MAKISIHGEIYPETYDEIYNILQNTKDALTIDIDSYGGDLRAGWKIYDLIRTSETPVFVNVSGECMSAAVLILLGAKLENRTANKKSCFMIHQPILPYIGYIDDDLCKEVHNIITKETNKLRACYLERTTANEHTINTLIKNKQEFGAELAKSLGFVNEINQYKLVNMKNKSLTNCIKSVLISTGVLKNEKEITTAEGDSLIVKTDEEIIKVGDAVDNEDGVYISASDGTKYIVEGGVITEIIPAEVTKQDETKNEEKQDENKDETPAPAEPTKEDEEKKKQEEEIKNLKSENEALKAQVAELQNVKADYDKAMELVNKCGGEANLNALVNVKGKDAKVESKDAKEDGEVDYNFVKNL